MATSQKGEERVLIRSRGSKIDFGLRKVGISFLDLCSSVLVGLGSAVILLEYGDSLWPALSSLSAELICGWAGHW